MGDGTEEGWCSACHCRKLAYVTKVLYAHKQKYIKKNHIYIHFFFAALFSFFYFFSKQKQNVGKENEKPCLCACGIKVYVQKAKSEHLRLYI